MEPEATGPLCPCGSCQTTVSRPGALQMAHQGLGQLGEQGRKKGREPAARKGSVVCGRCVCVSIMGKQLPLTP